MTLASKCARRVAVLIIITAMSTGCLEPKSKQRPDTPAAQKSPDTTASNSSNQASGPLRIANGTPIQAIDLEKRHAYYNFTSNDDYIVWYEGYFRILSIYDKNIDTTKTIHLEKGSAPHEFDQVVDIDIDDQGNIYISDTNNARIGVYSIDSGSFKSLSLKRSALRPVDIEKEKRILAVNEASTANMAGIIPLDEGTQTYKPSRSFTVPEDAAIKRNMMARDGELEVNSRYMIYAQLYRPRLYIFSLEKNKFLRRESFAESDVTWSEPKRAENGVVTGLPPKDVDLKVEGILRVPNSPHRVLLNIVGSSRDKNFEPTHLYEYDLDKKEFINSHDLNVNISEAFLSGENLYAYSEEELSVYKYDILLEK